VVDICPQRGQQSKDIAIGHTIVYGCEQQAVRIIGSPFFDEKAGNLSFTLHKGCMQRGVAVSVKAIYISAVFQQKSDDDQLTLFCRDVQQLTAAGIDLIDIGTPFNVPLNLVYVAPLDGQMQSKCGFVQTVAGREQRR